MSDDLAYYGDPGDIVPEQGRTKRLIPAERAEKAEAERDRLANQLLNEVPDSYIQMKARALDAEAAVARVREFLDSKDAALDDEARTNGHFVLVDTDSVRRALDGDAE